MGIEHCLIRSIKHWSDTRPNNTKNLLVFISLILVSIGGVIVPIGGLCFAEGKGLSIFVSPPTFELVLEPGKIYQDEIYVLNKSDLAIPMEARAVNFTAIDETGGMGFEAGQEDIKTNPQKWFKIQNPYFILEPHQSEKIKFEIHLPEDVEMGGYYAMILFEQKLPSHYFEEKTIKTTSTVGVLFLLSVGSEETGRVGVPITVVEFNIPRNFRLQAIENSLASIAGIFSEVRASESEKFPIVETGHLSFNLRIKNDDIYHIKPEGKLVLMTNSGRKIGETEIKKTTILPGKVRKFPVEIAPLLPEKIRRYLPAAINNFLSENFRFGKYRGHLSLKSEFLFPAGIKTGTSPLYIEKELEFFVFPWKILFIFSTAIILLIIARKRIIAAARMLIKTYPQP